MFRSFVFAFFAASFFSTTAFADHGFDHLVVNNTGRCWAFVARNVDPLRYDSGISFKLMTVAGDGKTDDLITFSLTYKEDFLKGTGWDETKTVQYTGSGLIKTIEKGQVNFEIYVDPGNNDPVVTIQGHYNPGSGSSDADDRIVMQLPDDFPEIDPIDPCDQYLIDVEELSEGPLGF